MISMHADISADLEHVHADEGRQDSMQLLRTAELCSSRCAAQELHEMLRQHEDLTHYPMLAQADLKRAMACPEMQRCHFKG